MFLLLDRAVGGDLIGVADWLDRRQAHLDITLQPRNRAWNRHQRWRHSSSGRWWLADLRTAR
jgi:hypothetical protein